MTHFYKRLFSDASVLLSGNLFTAVAGFLALALTARALGVEAFGLFVLIQSYVTVFGLFFSMQSWQPVIKFGQQYIASDDHDSLSAMLSMAVTIDVVIALCAFLLGLSLVYVAEALALLPAEAKLPMLIYLVFVAANVAGAFNGLLRLTDGFKLLAKIQVQAALLRMMLVVAAASLDADLVGFALAWVLPDIYTQASTLWVGWRRASSRQGVKIRLGWRRFAERRGFLGFLVTNNIDVSVRMISRYVDVFLLGILAGKEAVAIYKIAAQICSIPLRFSDPLYQVLLPHFSRYLSDGKPEQLRVLVVQLAGLGAAVFLLVFAGLALVGDWLIPLVFGSEFRDAYALMLVYFVSALGALAGLPFVPYFQAIGRTRVCMKLQIFTTAVYLAVLYPFILLWQETGAALAYIVYYLLWLSSAILIFRGGRN